MDGERPRRIFPASKPGDLPGLIQEIWGEDHPHLKLFQVCEELFKEHRRIGLSMITESAAEDGLLWLASDAAAYLDMVLEYADPETDERHDLPIDVLGQWLVDQEAPILDPVTNKMIEKPGEEIAVMFERRTRHISIKDNFSRTPAGRNRSSGAHSAEEFRDEILIPALLGSKAQIEIDLDGTAGIAMSFAEEAFGGLVRHTDLPKEEILSRVSFVATKETRLPERFRSFIMDSYK